MTVFCQLKHDTTVEAMMTALGVFNGILPPYAATFIIELYSTDNKKFEQKLTFVNINFYLA